MMLMIALATFALSILSCLYHGSVKVIAYFALMNLCMKTNVSYVLFTLAKIVAYSNEASKKVFRVCFALSLIVFLNDVPT